MVQKFLILCFFAYQVCAIAGNKAFGNGGDGSGGGGNLMVRFEDLKASV